MDIDETFDRLNRVETAILFLYGRPDKAATVAYLHQERQRIWDVIDQFKLHNKDWFSV